MPTLIRPAGPSLSCCVDRSAVLANSRRRRRGVTRAPQPRPLETNSRNANAWRTIVHPRRGVRQTCFAGPCLSRIRHPAWLALNLRHARRRCWSSGHAVRATSARGLGTSDGRCVLTVGPDRRGFVWRGWPRQRWCDRAQFVNALATLHVEISGHCE